MIANSVKFWEKHLSNIGDCDIGENTIVHSHVWIGDGVKIGKNCRIQAFAFIPMGVIIGDNVFIGPRVTFTNDKYPPSPRADWRVTVIKNDASLGAGTVVLPGIKVGERAKTGAGSVITKDVPEDETWVGVPAKRLK